MWQNAYSLRNGSLLKILAFSLALMCAACLPQKEEEAPPVGGAPLPLDPTRTCTVDSFRQNPDNQLLKKVDILFVMDTSGSMSDDWARVANNVVELVKEIPAQTDIRYGVLLGHVGKWRGKLFYTKKNAHSDRPAVLSNQDMTTQELAVELHKRFTEAMKIADAGSGESLFHSLYYAVTEKAAENQALGFFRSDAALSILFMSDEHEIGSHFPKPQAAGLPDRCDEDFEESIRHEYYTKKGITIDTLLKELKSLKGDMPVRASAFVNITAADLFKRNSKNASCLYDSLGYGYFDIVSRTKGVQFSIQENRAEGMAKVGECVRDSLQLVHDFKLSWPADEIEPASIQASVDGSLVIHTYSAITNSVHLDFAGAANSSVEISYCKPELPKEWNLVGFAGQANTNAVSLRWDTPEVATRGKVIWGAAPDALVNETEEEADFVTNHVVTVGGLQPDTVYYFQGISRDELGQEKRSIVVDVRTLPVIGTETETDTNTDTNTETNTDTSTGTDTETSTGTSTHTETNTGTGTNTTTDTGTDTGTDTSTDTNTAPNTSWQVLGFDGTTSVTSATLIWQTPGEATKATLKMGVNANDLTVRTIEVNEMSESHIVTVNGLEPNTTYFFQVVAVDQAGRSVESVVISKRTKTE